MRKRQTPKTRLSLDDALKQTWSRWTDVVELFALRRPGRKRIDPRWYAALHTGLLSLCRASAEDTDDEERHAYFNRLERIVEPWMTLRILNRTDREILVDLLSRCRDVESELTGHRRREAFWRRTIGYVLLSIATAGLCLLLSWIGRRPIQLVWKVQDWVDVAWLTVRHSSDLQRVFVAGVVIVVVSIFTISRTARS